jgi:hypothetical protein
VVLGRYGRRRAQLPGKLHYTIEEDGDEDGDEIVVMNPEC